MLSVAFYVIYAVINKPFTLSVAMLSVVAPFGKSPLGKKAPGKIGV
jgi:hypothetical protein